MQLRGYQQQTSDAVFDAWSNPDLKNVCTSLPTGAGKTVLAAGICRRLVDDLAARVAFITDRLPLMTATRRTMEAFGLRVAIIQAHRTSPQDEIDAANVLLCSAQTLHSRRILPDALDVFAAIVDECHVDRMIIREWLDSECYMLGLTATPLARWMFEPDDPTETAIYNHLIEPMFTREAISLRWLLDPLFRADIPDPTETAAESVGPPSGGEGDWSEDQAEQIMWPHLDAIVAAWIDLMHLPEADGGFDGVCAPSIVQAASIAHAEALAERFNAACLGAPPGGGVWSKQAAELAGGFLPITANTSQDDTDRRLALFNAGRLRGLVSVTKIAIGFDSPIATVLVSARPTRKLLAWIQLLGRIMRVPKVGYQRCVVLDCSGNGHRLAGRLHRFWSGGLAAVKRRPKPKPADDAPPEPPSTGDGGLPTCPDHPTVVQAPGAQVCRLCFRPLAEPEKELAARVWRDGVTRQELGRSVIALARHRLKYAPDDPLRVWRWARMQVVSLTGAEPAANWPHMAEITDRNPFTISTPHPVVNRLVKANMRHFREWYEADPAERPERPHAERIGLTA